MIAGLSAPRMVSMTSQFFLPMQKPRIARSLALLSIEASPSSRNVCPRLASNAVASSLFDRISTCRIMYPLVGAPPAPMLLTLTSWQKNRPRNHLHVQKPVANGTLRLNIYLIVPMSLNILYQQLRNVPITTSCFFQIFSRCIYVE